MATYIYQDAVNFAQSLVKGIPVSNISVLAVDQINSVFWKAYPWPWTRDTLTAIALVDGTQDYSLDATDQNLVWRMLNARVTQTLPTPTKYRDLRIMRHLEPIVEAKIGWPNFQLISYEVEIDKLRLEAAVQVPAGFTMRIDGEYQLFPPKVTSLSQTIMFPDYHMNVFCDGLLWMLYRFADDKRAGSAISTAQGVQYVGQMGIFYDGLVQTKEAEEHGAGDTVYPGESIGGTSLYFPGIYGY